jgi:signal transduction histidine kinase
LISHIFFIERNGKAQLKLIEELLDMASVICGKLRLDLELVDPVSVILEVVLRQNGVAPQ